MISFLIDSVERKVVPFNFNGNWDSVRDLIGARLLTPVELGGGLSLLVDEEGLYNQPRTENDEVRGIYVEAEREHALAGKILLTKEKVSSRGKVTYFDVSDDERDRFLENVNWISILDEADGLSIVEAAKLSKDDIVEDGNFVYEITEVGINRLKGWLYDKHKRAEKFTDENWSAWYVEAENNFVISDTLEVSCHDTVSGRTEVLFFHEHDFRKVRTLK